ncbi:MAG: gliding motility-associated C-terminal domain-containing protein, partial [Bacteroidia bacterium]|nr:gliding motility-associated C-terminal domain-containing protein [Bacteroidia bacterium]
WQFPENEVFIMDRWGALVRTIRNYNNRDNVFDGTDNQGRSLGNGDYYYILKLKSGPTLKGWVYLHR